MGLTWNGMIGRSGAFYPCGINEHSITGLANKHDAPFVIVRTHFGDTHIEFPAYYTADKTLPNARQVARVMEWCIIFEKHFDDITDCWSDPWEQWRSDE